jgi:hypothetical protein
MLSENNETTSWNESDLLVKARVNRSEIQLLAKYVEGMGHLGVVTTTDRMSGEVVIQTTTYCWPELRILLAALPLEITYLENKS